MSARGVTFGADIAELGTVLAAAVSGVCSAGHQMNQLGSAGRAGIGKAGAGSAE